MARISKKEAEKQEAIEHLRELLKPGDTVYTIIRRVSASGMSRCISVMCMQDGQPQHITYWVSEACGYSLKNVNGHDALSVSGCGMDMGFAVVYDLSSVLFPDGFGVKCSICGLRPSSVESAEYARDPVNAAAEAMHGNDDHVCTFYGRNGDPSGWDTDGGYALEQEWL